jgi:hypothetical protein
LVLVDIYIWESSWIRIANLFYNSDLSGFRKEASISKKREFAESVEVEAPDDDSNILKDMLPTGETSINLNNQTDAQEDEVKSRCLYIVLCRNTKHIRMVVKSFSNVHDYYRLGIQSMPALMW